MSAKKFERLLEIMARLRGPGGCPWDREQTLQTLRPYLIEEAYEVLDAIDRRDWSHLAEELGDLQLQIVFQAQVASEEGLFSIDDVLEHIIDKLIRRHPHVFGQESAETAGEVLHRWEEIKAQEKQRKRAAEKGLGNGQESLLDSIPRAQPALREAEQIAKRAAKSGFDWRDFHELIGKLNEEIRELEEAQASGRRDELEEELGDLLFMLVNVARHAKVNPELALRSANAKFRKRFAHIEQQLRLRGKSPDVSGIDEMEELWQQAKNL